MTVLFGNSDYIVLARLESGKYVVGKTLERTDTTLRLGYFFSDSSQKTIPAECEVPIGDCSFFLPYRPRHERTPRYTGQPRSAPARGRKDGLEENLLSLDQRLNREGISSEERVVIWEHVIKLIERNAHRRFVRRHVAITLTA